VVERLDKTRRTQMTTNVRRRNNEMTRAMARWRPTMNPDDDDQNDDDES